MVLAHYTSSNCCMKFHLIVRYAQYKFVTSNTIQGNKPAMQGPQSVFDIGHCTVIHCDAGDVSLADQ